MWFRRIFRLDSPKRQSPKNQPMLELGIGPRLDPETLRQLKRLKIRGSKALRGDRTGMRTSNRSKPATEFREHRMYVPGDDIRFVDWRASARHEGIFVRQGELPKDAIVSLLVDCSGSMLWGTREKREAQLALASALGFITLTNGDRLVVHPFGDIPNLVFGPATGKGNVSSFIRYLNQLRFGGQSNLEQAARSLSSKVSRGGVVFILSDLLERGDLSAVFSLLPAPKWWVNVIHMLHPDEIHPDLRGRYALQDLETGQLMNFDLSNDAIRKYHERLDRWRQDLELTAVEHHAFYTLIESEWSLSKEILPYLRKHQVLES